jgi:hypothetical protein
LEFESIVAVVRPYAEVEVVARAPAHVAGWLIECREVDEVRFGLTPGFNIELEGFFGVRSHVAEGLDFGTWTH